MTVDLSDQLVLFEIVDQAISSQFVFHSEHSDSDIVHLSEEAKSQIRAASVQDSHLVVKQNIFFMVK